jgi:hypothetical protein
MTHDMPPYLRSWLDETIAEAPKPDRVIGAVTAAVHHTPQQRGWLPLLDRGRQRMFAAMTSVVAVATLAVGGGLLLTIQESADPSAVGAAASASPSPSISPDLMGAAWVTGDLSGVCTTAVGGLAGSPEVTVEEGVTRTYPSYYPTMSITMSDPRVSGCFGVIYNQDTHSGAVGDLSEFTVGSGTYRLVNEAGSWEGPNIFLNEGASGTATVSDTGVLVGSGAYEGLSAFLVFDFTQNPVSVVGAIFPGEMPPVATFE